MRIGNNIAIARGSTPVSRVYRGQVQVWPESTILRYSLEFRYNTVDEQPLQVSDWIAVQRSNEEYSNGRGTDPYPLAFIISSTTFDRIITTETDMHDCSEISALNFGNGVDWGTSSVWRDHRSIGTQSGGAVYYNLPNLAQVQFSPNITEVYNCFSGCPNLTTIVLYANHNTYPNAQTIANIPSNGVFKIFQNDINYLLSSAWSELITNKGWTYEIYNG